MVVVFIKNYDIYKAGQQYTVERTLGARFCEMKVAIPYTVHLDNLAEQKRKAAEAEEAKKKKLLEDKEEQAKETADSKPAKTRSKSVKK